MTDAVSETARVRESQWAPGSRADRAKRVTWWLGMFAASAAVAAVLAPSAMGKPPRRADLVVSTVSFAAPTVPVGGGLRVADTTANLGKKPAGASRTTYYLSLDTKLNTKRNVVRVLGFRNVPRLRRGASHVGYATVSVPAVVPGFYYVLACADANKRVKESSERNNCRATASRVVVSVLRPPLDTVAPSPPRILGSTPASGSDAATVRLTGQAEAGSAVRVYADVACAGSPSVVGSAAEFSGPGLVVSVAQGQTTTFAATAVDAAANVSACSGPFSFEEIAAAEVEPNDDKAGADMEARDFGVKINRGRSFAGRLEPIAEQDVYRAELSNSAALRVTVSGRGSACVLGSNARVSLLAADGTTEIASSPSSLGAGCSTLTRTLPAGTYYVAVGAISGAPGPFDYQLAAAFEPAAVPVSTSPASPSPEPTPRLLGSASANSDVEVFATSDCTGPPVAGGTAADFAAPGLIVNVPAGTVKTFYARASAGGASGPCSNQSVAYKNSTTPPNPDPPEPPTITRASPASGSDTPTTTLSGTAQAGATVQIFKGDSCPGVPVASGTAGGFANPGLTVSVDQGTTTTFSAKAVDPMGNKSSCSQPFAFEEVAAAEVEPNDDKAGADAAAASFGVVIKRGRAFAGRLQPHNERDLFRVVLDAPTRLTLAVTTGPECSVDADPTITLFAADATTALGSDDDSLGARCSLLSLMLPAGTYYAAVQAHANGDPANASKPPFDYRLTAMTGPFAVPKATDPLSPSSNPMPKLVGSATPGAVVDVYATIDCSGAAIASGTADELASPGITVSVPSGTARTFYARARAGAEVGDCSPRGVAYVNSDAEIEPNDTRTGADDRVANGVQVTGTALYRARLDPATDTDVYAIRLKNEATLRLQTQDATAAGCQAPVDTVMTLLSAAGTELASNDDIDAVGDNFCSRIERTLAAGSYYVKIDNYSGPSRVAYPYTLVVNELPVARASRISPASPAAEAIPAVSGAAPPGATVEVFTKSDCSGTPGGTGRADGLGSFDISTTVGPNRIRPIFARASRDGVVGPCTDSGLVYESTARRPAITRTEAEPNDSKAGADAQGFTAATGDVIAGQVAAGADRDLFRLTTPGGVVRIETFDTTVGDCPNIAFDTNLRLLASDGATAVASDDDSGIAFCDAITRALPAGTYYIEVTRSSGAAAIDYRLAVSAPATGGIEPEVTNPGQNDNAPARAVPLSGADVEIQGGHQQPDDEDWYRLSLPTLASVRAEITESDSSSETCESNGMDSMVALYASNGTTLLARDDNSGRGRCSLLDGTGAAPANRGAFDLPAGNYYLRVTGAGSGDGAARTFDYRLNVVLR